MGRGSCDEFTLFGHLASGYRIVGFFKVLKFDEWLIFSFFTILFSRMSLPKVQEPQWVNRIVGFFQEVKFHK